MAHDIDRVIAANLRALRARQGIRQIDLAKDTGLSRPTIAALEKGSRRVTVADAIALCSALGVGVGALLQGDQDALRALGLDQTDEQAAQVWADALGDEGLDALAARLMTPACPWPPPAAPSPCCARPDGSEERGGELAHGQPPRTIWTSARGTHPRPIMRDDSRAGRLPGKWS